MSKPYTQGRRIIAHLKRKPHTYLDMIMLRLGLSPWKRVAETLHPDEKLIKGTDGQGRITWRVIRQSRVC